MNVGLDPSPGTPGDGQGDGTGGEMALTTTSLAPALLEITGRGRRRLPCRRVPLRRQRRDVERLERSSSWLRRRFDQLDRAVLAARARLVPEQQRLAFQLRLPRLRRDQQPQGADGLGVRLEQHDVGHDGRVGVAVELARDFDLVGEARPVGVAGVADAVDVDVLASVM